MGSEEEGIRLLSLVVGVFVHWVEGNKERGSDSGEREVAKRLYEAVDRMEC